MIEIDTRPVTPETTTPIKPSEAMRLGRMLYPRCEGEMVRILLDGDVAVCALGAMKVGYGWTPQITSYSGWWPEGAPNPRNLRCPDCGGAERAAASAVTHLNDEHHWPTERIADWLEGMGL